MMFSKLKRRVTWRENVFAGGLSIRPLDFTEE